MKSSPILSIYKIFKSPPDGEVESKVLPLNNLNNSRTISTPTNNSTNHADAQSRPMSSVAGRGSNSASAPQPSRIYSNQAPVHPSAAARQKMRPVKFYNEKTGGLSFYLFLSMIKIRKSHALFLISFLLGTTCWF